MKSMQLVIAVFFMPVVQKVVVEQCAADQGPMVYRNPQKAGDVAAAFCDGETMLVDGYCAMLDVIRRLGESSLFRKNGDLL